MYSCTIPRIGTVKRERPSGCLPSGRNTSATMRGSPMSSGTQVARQGPTASSRVISQQPASV